MLKWLRPKKEKTGKKKSKASSARETHSSARIVPRSEHGISRKDIDESALKVLYRLHKAGYQAHLVGGAVRDLLLKLHPKDFDVATDATPEQVKSLFRNCRLIGRRFRLAHIHFGRHIIEVATFRAGHGHSASGNLDASGRILRDNVYGDIGEDALRRDFTVNALYYNVADFSVIDYVGGYEDVQKGRLCLIGDPDERYREDPVRMLRAIRFAYKLGFTIEESCKQFIIDQGALLQDIPSARLYDEVLKIFHSGHARECLQGLLEYNLFQYLFPEAANALERNDTALQFLKLAMQSTDDRIQNDLPVTPAFLFAALLWAPLQEGIEKRCNDGEPYALAMQKVAAGLISKQVHHISIPRRFTNVMRDIWFLQSRFKYHSGKRSTSVFEHPKFRAGYDFLCLRAKAGEDVSGDCEWWTEFQEKTPASQRKPVSAGRRRHGSRRRQTNRH
jgi:poly(A) polymerase